jgi:hypothetical protein
MIVLIDAAMAWLRIEAEAVAKTKRLDIIIVDFRRGIGTAAEYDGMNVWEDSIRLYFYWS